MMIRMADEDIKLSESMDEWFTFDKNGNYVLREDTPPEIREMQKKLKEKYSWIES